MTNTDSNTTSSSYSGEFSEERQKEMINLEIPNFIKLAKDKGSISTTEINDGLPPEIVAP